MLHAIKVVLVLAICTSCFKMWAQDIIIQSDYTLSSETFEGGKIYIGSSAAPTFHQVAGDVICSDIIFIGLNSEFSGGHPYGPGHYILDSGTISAARLRVGYSCPSTFEQNGGSANYSISFILGNANYALRGGSLCSWLQLIGSDEPFVGNSQITQEGGTNVSQYMLILANSGYSLSGGTLTFQQLPEGIFKAPHALDCQGTFDFGSGSGQIVVKNAGVLDFTRATLVNPYNANIVLNYACLLKLPAGYDPAAFTHVTGTGLISVSGRPLTVPTGSRLHETGTIVGDVTNRGIVAPGSSPGILNLTGNYEQKPEGTLEIELSGKSNSDPNAYQYDQFIVTGDLDLTGTLKVIVNTANYTPHIGDQWRVLTGASREGMFSSLSCTNLGNGMGISPIYDNTGMSLEIVSVPEPATLSLLAAGMLLGLRRRKN